MKVLAIAIPNIEYENFRSLADVVLKACIENNRIFFLETHLKKASWIVEIKQETVESLFPLDIPHREKPFLKKENLEFYAVVFRNHQRYKGIFQKLKNPRI